MDSKDYMLTAEQYNEPYCRAFARLDEIACLAEQAMKELEALQLSMAEESPFGQLIPFPHRRGQGLEK